MSYVVLCIKMDGILPGSPTIPEQIAEDKSPYYRALEAADAVWKHSEEIDLGRMEELLRGMLANQLYDAVKAASREGS